MLGIIALILIAIVSNIVGRFIYYYMGIILYGSFRSLIIRPTILGFFVLLFGFAILVFLFKWIFIFLIYILRFIFVFIIPIALVIGIIYLIIKAVKNDN